MSEESDKLAGMPRDENFDGSPTKEQRDTMARVENMEKRSAKILSVAKTVSEYYHSLVACKMEPYVALQLSRDFQLHVVSEG